MKGKERRVLNARFQNDIQELGVEAKYHDKVAANVESWPLQAAILKIKGTKTMHSRRN